MESPYERSPAIRPAWFIISVLLLSLFSCSQSAPLGILLARIDQKSGAPSLALYLKALDNAYSTDEKLRVLKRLGRADRATVFAVVAQCDKKQNTEPVILALIDFYLDANRFSDAFALFDANLSCRDYPELYAEIVLSALKDKVILYSASLENLHFAGIENSQPVLLYCAALKCMAAGNPSAAAMFVREASDLSYSVGASLLWDTGLFGLILSQESSRSGPDDYLYLMSGAYISGNRALTASIAKQFFERFPDSAWQPYIALGVLAFQAGTNAGENSPAGDAVKVVDWTHRDEVVGYRELDNADFWFTSAYRLFPAKFEVLDAFMKWRMLSDDSVQIPDEIKNLQTDEQKDRIRFISEINGASSARISSLAVELAAKHLDSSEVLSLSLFTLFKERSWTNFLQLLNQSKNRGAGIRTDVFYDLAAAVCREDLAQAIQYIHEENSKDSYAYIYNLGLLEISLKNYGKALDAMIAAASKAPTAGEKSRALIHVSHIAKMQGNHDLSEAYKRSAISLDPNCLPIPENSSLLYGR